MDLCEMVFIFANEHLFLPFDCLSIELSNSAAIFRNCPAPECVYWPTFSFKLFNLAIMLMWIVFIWASFNIKFGKIHSTAVEQFAVAYCNCNGKWMNRSKWKQTQKKRRTRRRRSRERCGKRQLRKVLSVDYFYVCSVPLNLSMRMNEWTNVCANVDIGCKWRGEPCLTAGDDCTLFQCEYTLNSPVNLINCVTRSSHLCPSCLLPMYLSRTLSLW